MHGRDDCHQRHSGQVELLLRKTVVDCSVNRSASVYVAGLYSDGLARVWDLRSNRSMRWLHGIEQPGMRASNEVAASSRSQSVPSSPESTSTKAPSTGEEEKIKNLCRPCISMWRAGRELDSPLLYIPGLDRRVHAVDLLSGRPIAKSPVGHACPISSICCCSTGEVLVGRGVSLISSMQKARRPVSHWA
ncbi:hypothetical protein FOZ63_005744 [Perkinsus olseni]|uniref:Uncharacterized protein n=1 Tax=Perkinsus olseni TaxID=32597 RepID=A0A7J6S4K1_PEROL|nr:hypothetical protein FOZ63_005744 [Perkinsus olseni]